MHYCNKSLEHNEIGGFGASALADALRVNQSFDYYDSHLPLTQSHIYMLDYLRYLPESCRKSNLRFHTLSLKSMRLCSIVNTVTAGM